jgi:hypothetical protein
MSSRAQVMFQCSSVEAPAAANEAGYKARSCFVGGYGSQDTLPVLLPVSCCTHILHVIA